MKRTILLAFSLIVSLSTIRAQVPIPSIGPPINLDLGVGGGISLPNGKLNDSDNTGFHVGAKARLHGSIPVNIVLSGNYNRLPNKSGSESDVIWMIGAGLEYPIPSIEVKPYLGADVLVSSFSSTAAGSQSITREGLGLGAGVAFPVPAVGNFDVSVKYQMLNLVGKESNEDTISQIAANVSLMFSIF